MRAMKTLFLRLAGVFLSLLPTRYRRRVLLDIDVQDSAVFSGVVQMFAGIGALVIRYPGFVESRMALVPESVSFAMAEKAGEVGVMSMGLIWLVDYLFNPLTLVIEYFVVEGVVRWVAALVTREVVPTLPLWVLALVHTKFDRWKAEHDLGPRVPDEVKRVTDTPDVDLIIASCRPKKEWHKLTSVAYQDEFFEIMDLQEGAPPRIFIYVLRKSPQGRVLRGIYQYHPDEALRS
jgi:hypothetical protein